MTVINRRPPAGKARGGATATGNYGAGLATMESAACWQVWYGLPKPFPPSGIYASRRRQGLFHASARHSPGRRGRHGAGTRRRFLPVALNELCFDGARRMQRKLFRICSPESKVAYALSFCTSASEISKLA
jgi:hypothetical protein